MNLSRRDMAVVTLCVMAMTIGASAFLSGCTITRVTDGNGSGYTRASLGGDYFMRGLSVEATTNGIVRWRMAGMDDKREESFIAACKSLEAIAIELGKLAVKP